MSLHVLLAALVFGAPQAPAPESAVEAFELFEEGEAAYRDRRYSAAATFFERAFELHGEPAYLFNQGLALMRAERYVDSERAFGDFIKRFPDTPRDAEVRERLAEVRRLRGLAGGTISVETIPAGVWARVIGAEGIECHSPCELQVDAGTPEVELIWKDHREVVQTRVASGQTWRIGNDLLSSARASSDARGPSRVGSWVSWGVGAAALATGVAFAIAADSAYGQARSLSADSPLSTVDFDRFEALRSDVRLRSTAADVAWSVAVTGAIVGTVLWLAADDPDAPGDAEVATWHD